MPGRLLLRSVQAQSRNALQVQTMQLADTETIRTPSPTQVRALSPTEETLQSLIYTRSPSPSPSSSSSPSPIPIRVRRKSISRQTAGLDSRISILNGFTSRVYASSSEALPPPPSLASITTVSVPGLAQKLPFPSDLPRRRRRNSVTVSALPSQRLRGIAMAPVGSPLSQEEMNVQAQLPMWNDNINQLLGKGQPESALGLIEAMLDPLSRGQTPRPSNATYNIILRGFCNANDHQTAFAWFNQLLNQPQPAPLDPNEPLTMASRPNREAWTIMLSTLAKFDVPTLNRAISTFISAANLDLLEIVPEDRRLIVDANIRYIAELGAGNPNTDGVLDALLAGLRTFPVGNSEMDRQVTVSLAGLLHQNGRFSQALQVIRQHVDVAFTTSLSSDVRYELGLLIQSCYESFPIDATPFSLDEVLTLSGINAQFGLPPLLPNLAIAYIQAFLDARVGGSTVSMSTPGWSVMAEAFCAAELGHHETVFPALAKVIPSEFDLFLSELRSASVDLPRHINELISDTLLSTRGPGADVDAVITPPGTIDIDTDASTTLGPSSLSQSPAISELTLPPPRPTGTPPIPLISNPVARVNIDTRLSRSIDDDCYSKRSMAPFSGFAKLESGARHGAYPTPETLGRLINSLGRAKDVEKIRRVYELAQIVLGSLEEKRQTTSWFHIEDQMVEAMAHASDLEAAGVHRSRIIQYGGVPSADSYGALISSIKDTTDDATVAIDLFEESQRLGTRPNTFLYNTIISKLSRARKASLVLDLFRRMTDEGLRPSSVTYGAVICSCCRVGDGDSAAYLFEKMITMPNFRPRATPYNTLIQYYCQNEPNREKALFYYEALLAADVKPTAHTYKLLLDCYGTLEPVQMEDMHRIFQELVEDPSVVVQGSHWASLINAWGCVHKDLDRAISIFESIPTHPSSAKSKHRLPDAIIFETMINVLVTLRRMDLVPAFVRRLHDTGIHMTAYIANSLIKGHATAGDIEQARAIFEGMHDPPMGVAAYNNHAGSERDSAPFVNVDTPIYREPSSWEAMCRAELGAGERQRAIALLDRMTARLFPEALTSRIRRIVREDDC